MTLRRLIRVWKWKFKRRVSRAEVRLAELLYGKRVPKGKLWWTALFLRLWEGLFRLIVKTRWSLYKNRLFKQAYLGCLVVVIGNLTVGGTGKTPVVEKFARALAARGRKVAILSRGYKRREVGWLKKLFSLIDPTVLQPTLVSDGSGKVFCDWRRAGDEPYMLARNLPNVAVIVDKNRVKAGAWAIRKLGVDTLLLDDGFQYYPLKSRMSLLLIDQTNPFGSGAMLPRGILREPISAMKRANTIFITKSDGHPPKALLDLIARYHPTATPILCRHAPIKLCPLDSSLPELPLSVLAGARVFAFSGIATPENFERQLVECGATIVKRNRYTDHYSYEPEDLEQLVSTAASLSVSMMITTEKDAVRLPKISSTVPLYYLRMEIEILGGACAFEAAVDGVCNHGHSMPFV